MSLRDAYRWTLHLKYIKIAMSIKDLSEMV